MQPPWQKANPTSAWRTEVRSAVQRLRNELNLLTQEQRAHPAAGLAEQALSAALDAANAPRTLAGWWSGDQVERAWRAVKEARADLVLVQDDVVAQGRIVSVTPTLRTRASTVATPAAASTPIQQHQEVIAANAASDQEFAAARQLRNALWILTAILVVFVAIALILDVDHRSIILVGGLAGAFTGILPLASATKLLTPYSVTLVQVLIKIPAGAIAALLGVYFLAGSVGALAPATGATAYFYAVLFGLSQQALTGLADNQVKKLAA